MITMTVDHHAAVTQRAHLQQAPHVVPVPRLRTAVEAGMSSRRAPGNALQDTPLTPIADAHLLTVVEP
jgi:hypothetical protein